MKINSKVYYDVRTGCILAITCEMQGDIKERTVQEDMETYSELKGKNMNEVDFIELEYGTASKTFSNVKAHKVNIKTKQLEITYYTQEELASMQKQQ